VSSLLLSLSSPLIALSDVFSAGRHVVANDLSASAVEDIRRNIDYNGFSPKGLKSLPGTDNVEEKDIKPNGFWSKAQIEEAVDGKVRVNEGDAWFVLHARINLLVD